MSTDPLDREWLAELRSAAVAADHDDPEDGRLLPLDADSVSEFQGSWIICGGDGDGFASVTTSLFGCHNPQQVARFWAISDPVATVALIDAYLNRESAGDSRLRTALEALAAELEQPRPLPFYNQKDDIGPNEVEAKIAHTASGMTRASIAKRLRAVLSAPPQPESAEWGETQTAVCSQCGQPISRKVNVPQAGATPWRTDDQDAYPLGCPAASSESLGHHKPAVEAPPQPPEPPGWTSFGPSPYMVPSDHAAVEAVPEPKADDRE